MTVPMPRREITYQIPNGEYDPVAVCPWSTPGGGPPLDVPGRLGFEAAARVGQGRGAKVLIVGTGVQVHHPGLFMTTRTVRRFAGKGDATVDPVGHGTFLAGVLAGRTSLEDRSAVAPLAEVYSAAVWSPLGYATEGAVVEALRWAREIKPDVILWGVSSLYGETRTLDLIHETTELGALHVAPVGSGNRKSICPTWPGKSEVVVAVTGLNGAGDPLSGCVTGADVTCGAWGGPRFGLWSGGRVACLSGCGPAAALVAGFVAVMAGLRRERQYPVSADILREELLGSCHVADCYREKRPTGSGELRPHKWLALRQGDGYRADQPPLPLPPSPDPAFSAEQWAELSSVFRKPLRAGQNPE